MLDAMTMIPDDRFEAGGGKSPLASRVTLILAGLALSTMVLVIIVTVAFPQFIAQLQNDTNPGFGEPSSCYDDNGAVVGYSFLGIHEKRSMIRPSSLSSIEVRD